MMRYVASALEPSSWPKIVSRQGIPLPEIALAGRSNAGKSTFVNLFGGRKKIAKVSSTPGKTQRIQFFTNDLFVLVDLPGYGFAEAPESARAEWSSGIDEYLNHCPHLKLLLLCLDIRRMPSRDDLAIVAWAKEHQIPLLPVLTKTDMLPRNQCQSQEKQILEILDVDSRPIWVPASHQIIEGILKRYL